MSNKILFYIWFIWTFLTACIKSGMDVGRENSEGFVINFTVYGLFIGALILYGKIAVYFSEKKRKKLDSNKAV